MESIPSIGNVSKHSSRTKKYKNISTEKVLNRLITNGFNISDAQTVRCRDKERIPFSKHLIRLRHNDFNEYEGSIPEIVLVNAHDGSSAYKLYLGVFRMVCSNGMIVSSQDFGSISIRHIGKGSLSNNVLRASNSLIRKSGKLFDTINRWKEKELSNDDINAFSGIVENEIIGKDIHNNVLTRCFRYSDKGSDFWTVFNRIQENVIKGRYSYLNEMGRFRSGRKVNSINSNVSINTKLWNLGDTFYKNLN
jgi:hypothetical protein